MFEHGRGVAHSFVEAREWYEKAVAQRHVDSIVNLAVMFEMGKGVDKDVDKALELLARATELGDAAAQGEIDRILASPRLRGRTAVVPIGDGGASEARGGSGGGAAAESSPGRLDDSALASASEEVEVDVELGDDDTEGDDDDDDDGNDDDDDEEDEDEGFGDGTSPDRSTAAAEEGAEEGSVVAGMRTISAAVGRAGAVVSSSPRGRRAKQRRSGGSCYLS